MSSNTSSILQEAGTVRPTSRLAADIMSVGRSLRGVVSGLDPRNVPLTWAPDVLEAFAEVERIAASGRVLMTARAAEAGEWERQRFATPADWLAAQQGTTAGRARADLETSERLADLDATSNAVRAGLLSPEQAGAVADAASTNPEAESDMLERAQRDSLRRTRLEAERRKAEARSEDEKAERDRRVREERSARFWYAGGAGNLQVRGPMAELQELEQLIQREVDRKFRANRAPAQRGSRANDAFDALIELGRGSSTSSGKRAPLTRMALIRVDLAALTRGHTEGTELCEIGGVAVSIAELRRLLGESVMQLVLTNGQAVIDVVNLSRKPTVAQMLAKLFTDSCCTAEGCDRAVRLEFDHRDDWSRVRVTELANLDLLCDHHHDLKTLEDWQLVAGSGRRPMVPPTDPRHPSHAAGDASTDEGRAPAGPERPDLRAVPTDDGEAPPPSTDARRDDRGVADLSARLARIRSTAQRRDADATGQDSLFDTG